MRSKIINIMPFPPAYELFWNEPRPEISWNTPNGTWVGVWGKDWSELIGKEVLKSTNEFEYEVWQPDLRADRIYTHTFTNGLVRKLFPAELKKRIYGFKKNEYVVSRSLYSNLITENIGNKVMLHLNGINPGISRNVLSLTLNCPIVLQFFGKIILPLDNLIKFKKNVLSKVSDVFEHIVIRKLLNEVAFVAYCNGEDRVSLERYVNARTIVLPVGIDFDFWRRKSEKNSARKRLGLRNTSFILLSSSRLNSLKQIDRMIDVLRHFSNDFDFQYIVTGHGNHEYEEYLARLGESLIKKGKLKFVGFLPEDKLVDYYSAADLFVTTSLLEGGPISAVKAIAMEMPIFSTMTGMVAEFLSKYKAGVLVPATNYEVWEQSLKNILTGSKIETIDREWAESFFHWPNVARKYVQMYEELSANSSNNKEWN